MKTVICFFVVSYLAWQAYGGTETSSGKDMGVQQEVVAPCEWYRAHEWNLNLWGTYAISGNPGHNFFPKGLDAIGDLLPESFVGTVDLGPVRGDRFLNRDGAWGGGADVKFFFSKYWALGAEGFVVDANDNTGGAGLGTVTFRFPIGCSRFAPYGFAGVGVLGGGSHTSRFYSTDDETFEFVEDRHFQNKHALAVGQFGAGLEVRITRHIGVMADFAWNVVQEGNNDFGMGRFGVTLSY